MKRLPAVLAASVALAGASGSQRVLHELEPIEWQSVVCGCSFNESLPEAAEGSYGTGPEILVLDPNSDPPSARVNLGTGNTRLRAITQLGRPVYNCDTGSVWSSDWVSPEVTLQVELVATSPGAEACWFSGVVTAATASAERSVPIKGGCGC